MDLARKISSKSAIVFLGHWGLRMIALIVLLAVAAACGSGDASGDGSGTSGEKIFNQSVVGGLAGCATCHSLEPDVILIGPSLANIGTKATERISGQSAEDYLRASILDPAAYIVSGFPVGVMPGTYANNLTQDEVDSLVDYLLAVK